MNRQQRARARTEVHRLRDEGLKVPEIVERTGIPRSTVYRLLSQERSPAPVGAAGPGNDRNLVHGARSAAVLAPLIAEHTAALRRDYAWLDDRRLNLLAQKLAIVDQATAWLAEQGTVLRDEDGNTYGVVSLREKASDSAWRMLGEIQAESREREAAARAPGLAAYVDSTYGEGAGDDAVTDAEEADQGPGPTDATEPTRENEE